MTHTHKHIHIPPIFAHDKYEHPVHVRVCARLCACVCVCEHVCVFVPLDMQAFRLGRYTIHWHMHGDVNYQSWIIGCAIHHTYNRAATIHGTHNVITRDTVSYDVMGHAFFLEDGIETGNIYENNVVCNRVCVRVRACVCVCVCVCVYVCV